MLTSCFFPSLKWIIVGMLPRKSNRVCNNLLDAKMKYFVSVSF